MSEDAPTPAAGADGKRSDGKWGQTPPYLGISKRHDALEEKWCCLGSTQTLDPLPQQPSCCDCGTACGVSNHKGIEPDYPAYDGMLKAGMVAGTYDEPCCPSFCTLWVSPVPALGFLCICQKVGPIPILCWIAPFNCLGGLSFTHCCWNCGEGKCLGGLGTGGTPIDVFYCPTSKCLPGRCTLAGTWFCSPCQCYDWVDNDTMVSSFCCCGAVLHRKLAQGVICPDCYASWNRN